jgi:hypothetical protein
MIHHLGYVHKLTAEQAGAVLKLNFEEVKKAQQVAIEGDERLLNELLDRIYS